MTQERRRTGGPTGRELARPLAVLALALAATAVLWHLLVREPGRDAREHLSQGDRTALERVLRGATGG